jgi:hypothetical protein
MPRQPLTTARSVAAARTTAAVRTTASARSVSSAETSWKKIFFPFSESIANPKRAVWGYPITGTFASGEVIRGQTSGATGTVISSGYDTQTYYNYIIHTPLSGSFSEAGENIIGEGSGAIMGFDFGTSVFNITADDTNSTFIGASANAAPGHKDLVFSNSGWIGVYLDARRFMGTNFLTGIDDNDFIFQVVLDPQVSDINWANALGDTNSGNQDTLRLREGSTLKCAYVGNAAAPDNIEGGITMTTGLYSAAIVRRGNAFMALVDNAQQQPVWKELGAGNVVMNQFTSYFSLRVPQVVPSDALKTRYYGMLLALFPPGQLPAMDIVLAGCNYHKTQWSANNKVLYTGW